MKKLVAEQLLKIEAVCLRPNDPFTWTSGIKSPIYCDNRMVLSFPEARNIVRDGLIKLVQEQYPEAEMVAGCATAGIPHAAYIADHLGLPMCYVRSEAKKHGRGNQIEGQVQEGQKVVVIEDLLSTGKSSLACVDALREAGCQVLGIVAIFSYELPVLHAALETYQLEAVTLSNYSTLIEVAVEVGAVDESTLNKLAAWRENPQDPSWMEK